MTGTDPKLLALIRRAAKHKMTPEEVFEQRASFVYGQQDHNDPDLRTKDEIRQLLIEAQGRPRCPKCGAA